LSFGAILTLIKLSTAYNLATVEETLGSQTLGAVLRPEADNAWLLASRQCCGQ